MDRAIVGDRLLQLYAISPWNAEKLLRSQMGILRRASVAIAFDEGADGRVEAQAGGILSTFKAELQTGKYP